MVPPRGTLLPAWDTSLNTLPSSKACISIVALSVSTSAITLPISTLSPSLMCHLARVPSVIVSLSLGILMSFGMTGNRLW